MNVTQTIQPWGNSAGVRLPQRVLKAAKLKPKQDVYITVEDSAIVLRPVDTHKSNRQILDEMLQGVTPENVHGELDWGSPVGKEIW